MIIGLKIIVVLGLNFFDTPKDFANLNFPKKSDFYIQHYLFLISEIFAKEFYN